MKRLSATTTVMKSPASMKRPASMTMERTASTTMKRPASKISEKESLQYAQFERAVTCHCVDWMMARRLFHPDEKKGLNRPGLIL